ncbi:MAG: cytochrome P450 [Woeseiaceae bacterium]|jgi:cytochrome P450|nr:cytochrome P450 [Woeseiaceae bacterium]
MSCPVSMLSDNFKLGNAELESIYATARANDPVSYLPDIDFWAVTRFADVKSILKDTDTFSCEIAMDPIVPFSAEMVRCLQEGNFAGKSNLVANPEPSHDRVRRIAQRGFFPKAMVALEPRIRKLVVDTIGEFSNEPSVDLVEVMLYELPAKVVFMLLGIPDEAVKNVKRWSDNRLLLIFGKLTKEQQLAAAHELVDFWQYCVEHVEHKEKNPGSDLPSDMLAARNGDDSVLSKMDITLTVFGLLLAGHETTSNMSANAVLALLENEGRWQQLNREPGLIPNAVEELIRYRPSVVAWRRKTLKPVEISGVKVPADARLLLFLASANRDTEIFDEPNVLNLERKNARSHVSFGYGAHFCLGAPLARLELQVILEELTQRLPDLRLAASQQFSFVETVQFRGPKALQVEL